MLQYIAPIPFAISMNYSKILIWRTLLLLDELHFELVGLRVQNRKLTPEPQE